MKRLPRDMRQLSSLALLFAALIARGESLTESTEPQHPDATNWFSFTIHQDLPSLRFHLVRGKNLNNVVAIEVFRNTETDAFQTLTNATLEPGWEGADGLYTEDMDFDGIQDLKILSWWGATGNLGYNCWLYDTNANRFVFSAELSELCRPEFDAATKHIRTSTRGGAREFSLATYIWERDKLLMKEEISQQQVGRPFSDWLQRISPVRLKFLERDPDYERITRTRTTSGWIVKKERVRLEDIL